MSRSKWLSACALLALTACVEDVLLARECPQLGCAMDAGALDASLDAGSCALGSADASACACEVGATSVLASWSLDEGSGRTARDALGSHHGNLQHALADMPWVAGRIGGALSFDGVDDAVNIGAVPGGVRSLSLWLQARSRQRTTSRTRLQLPSSHGPLDEWSQPALAYADDDMNATTARLLGSEAQQHWGGFHIARALPRGANILGLTVTADSGNLGLLGGLSVELSADGGSTHTESRYGWGQLILGSDLRQVGGTDKLWGRSWTPPDFADANFLVRASFNGIANAMSLDYLGVEVAYSEQTLERTILGLAPGVALTFSGDSVTASGWSASTYVNGVVGGPLRDGWNHVAVVGERTLAATDVRLGDATFDTLTIPFDGALDEVLLFGEPLSAVQVEGLARAPACAPR